MEKHIASRDLSDMILFEHLEARSKRYIVKHAFEPVRKLIDHSFNALEGLKKSIKRSFTNSKQAIRKDDDLYFATTASAVYAILFASTLISFFWLSLLIAT